MSKSKLVDFHSNENVIIILGLNRNKKRDDVL